jgi:EpsG family
MIYFLTLLLLAALAMPPDNGTRPARVTVALLVLLLLGGLRDQVGTDWDAYMDVFDAVGAGESFSALREENGFLSLVWALHALGGGFGLFVFLLFALSLGIKAFAARLYGVELNAALLIYFSAIFLIYDVNGLRQGLAMGLVLVASWAAYQGHALRFAGTMSLAVSVHMIALVALPMYGMTKTLLFVQNQWARAGLLLVGCVLCYFGAGVVSSSTLSNYLEVVNLVDRYDYYLEQFDTAFNPLGPGSLQRILVALVVVFTIDSIATPRRLKVFLYNAHALALLSYFLFSFNVEFMARISFYYKCLDLVTLPLILTAQPSLTRRLLFLAFLASLTSAQVYQVLSIPDGGLLPYRSLWWR